VVNSVASFNFLNVEDNSPVATNKDDVAIRKREEAFMSRYDALFRWAYSLTNDRAEAEDLMQDCYALFVSANINPLIEDLDAYLRRMLSNLRQSNLMRQTNGQANRNKPDRAAPISRSKSPDKRMFRQDKLHSAQTERNLRQIVADAYTWLWDLAWRPIGLLSRLAWQLRLFPAHWAPWLFGSRFGRWPEKINDDHYAICTDSDCETCRSLEPGELDIDDEREIKHDPFGVLSNLKHNS
jgi:hypothetical protein